MASQFFEGKSKKSDSGRGDIKLSKLLSWILRHGAVQCNLPINADGYMKLSDLLASDDFKRNHFTTDDIRRVVKTNDKNRFKLHVNDNGVEMIKANQGHSMANVDQLSLVEIKTADELPICVHGTYHRFWASIKHEGLKTMGRNHIHCAATDSIDFKSSKSLKISGFRSNCEILIYINCARALGDGIKFFRSENNVILTEGLPESGCLPPVYFAKVVDRKTGINVRIHRAHSTNFTNFNWVALFVFFFRPCHNMSSAVATTSSSSSTTKSKPATKDKPHANNIKIKCSLCGKYYGKHSDYRRHMFQDHGKGVRKSKRGKQRNVETQDQDDLFNALRDCNEGEEIRVLISHIQPGEDLVIEIHNRIVEDLKHVFDKVLRDYDIKVFGSTITGLAMKDSDFDFFVNVRDVNLENLNDVKTLIRNLRIEFQQHNDLFNRSIPIYSAKVPLLKLSHRLTGIELDINFSNSFGIYNSAILRKLVKFDYRIYPLVIILKYWGKIYQITGSGKITNYSFTLMILFMLQTLDEPIVPPIKKFQDNISATMVNNCNFSFNDGLENTTKNRMTVFALLKEFFCYYANFDFAKHIICPYLGKTIARTEFNGCFKTNDNSLFNLKTPICVQDPFEQNRNIITCCNKRNSELFIHMVKATKTILMDEQNDVIKSSEILIKMLNQKLLGINKSKTQKKGITTETNKFLCKLNVNQIEVQYLKVFLPLKQGNGVKVNFHKMWCTYFVDMLKPIFENVYQMECEKLNATDYQDIVLENNLLNSETKLNENHFQIYKIKTSSNVWKYLTMPISYQADNYIELQYDAIKTMLATESDVKTGTSETVLVKCMVVIKLDVAFNFIEINFYNELENSDDNLEQFQSFFKHFVANVRNFVRGHLRDYQNLIKFQDEQNLSK